MLASLETKDGDIDQDGNQNLLVDRAKDRAVGNPPVHSLPSLQCELTAVALGTGQNLAAVGGESREEGSGLELNALASTKLQENNRS